MEDGVLPVIRSVVRCDSQWVDGGPEFLLLWIIALCQRESNVQGGVFLDTVHVHHLNRYQELDDVIDVGRVTLS